MPYTSVPSFRTRTGVTTSASNVNSPRPPTLRSMLRTKLGWLIGAASSNRLSVAAGLSLPRSGLGKPRQSRLLQRDALYVSLRRAEPQGGQPGGRESSAPARPWPRRSVDRAPRPLFVRLPGEPDHIAGAAL